MSGLLFNLPIPFEYENKKDEDIQEFFDEFKKLIRDINENWDNLPEEKKEELINFYYKVIEQDFSFFEKVKGIIFISKFIMKYGFQQFIELSSLIKELLNTISSNIERENINYSKDLEKSLSDEFEKIEDIDEFIRELGTSTK